jgi:hypothetical protein
MLRGRSDHRGIKVLSGLFELVTAVRVAEPYDFSAVYSQSVCRDFVARPRAGLIAAVLKF